jgi:hypothetical protein
VPRIKHVLTLTLAVALSLGAFSSCSNNPTLTGSSTTGSNLVFHQLDIVGNAGTNEYFAPWANHDANNRAVPATSNIDNDITTFITSTAGRSTGIANYAVTNLLYPDVLLADFSQTGDASYLGVQSQGLINDICEGTRSGSGKFGGRGLLDDVVTATFNIAYGNTVPVVSAANAAIAYPNVTATAVPDDGKEQNGTGGTPQLTTDNVGCAGKHYNFAQFPYLGAPI